MKETSQYFGNKGYILELGQRGRSSRICRALANISVSLQKHGPNYDLWTSMDYILNDLSINSYVLDFTKLYLDLLEFDASEEYLYFRLNYKFSHLIMTCQMDDMELLELDLTHRLLKLMDHFGDLDMEKFLELSSSFCETNVFSEILNILADSFSLGSYSTNTGRKKTKETLVTSLLNNVSNNPSDDDLKNILTDFEKNIRKNQTLSKAYITVEPRTREKD